MDIDDWAKEPCQCGHARYRHYGPDGAGGCSETRMQKAQPPDLPAPIYATNANPWLDEPMNWPPYDTWPEVEVACCTGYYEADLARAEMGPW